MALTPLTRLADGTVKQVNPFTLTQVWTVPGRANRPLTQDGPEPQPIDPARHDYCAFCSDRYRETTPERERVVRSGSEWVRRVGVSADELEDEVADFRSIGNLFEIITYDYWVANHGYRPSPEALARHAAYCSTPAGRAHLLALMRTRDRASGVAARSEHDLLADSLRFFAGCHDVVISRRHYDERATTDRDLSFSGSLTREEHEQYVALTIRSMQRLYETNPHAVLVQAFQNWLKPAGASFDHLHKQLVAVDEYGTDLNAQLARAAEDPDLYRRWGPDYSESQGLVIAQNEHAVAVAGVGHRFPAVEVWSTHEGRPWELGDAAVRGWSDLLRDLHRTTGVGVPTNEEWHHQVPGVDRPSPLRAVLKWRINTPAGFEGGTRIYVNTIDPWTVAERVRVALEGDKM